MRLTLKDDIALPAATVFAAATDFSYFERAAAKSGARMVPSGPDRTVRSGLGWDLRFPFRGRERQMAVELTAIDPQRSLTFSGNSPNLFVVMGVSVLSLARDRSRLSLDIDIRPKTLTARLLIQSAKLSKGRIEKRLAARLSGFGRELERRSGRA